MFYNTLQNAIINGGFNFWQRGTNFPAIASSVYFADKWKFNKGGTHVETVSRSTDIPLNSPSQYSALVTVTTAQAALGATGSLTLNHFIEGTFASRLYGKKIAVSFWVKSSKVGTYCIRIGNAVNTRFLVREYTVSVVNTWEKKVVRLSHDNIGTWLKDNGMGMSAVFTLSAGTNYNTAPENQWFTTDQVATSNQVNWTDTIGATFQISDVVMVEDNTEQTRVPNFVMAGRDYLGELFLCQRYFEKSYNLDIAPGTNGVTEGLVALPPIDRTTGNRYALNRSFSAQKRINPTIVPYNVIGTAGVISQYNGTGSSAVVPSGIIASTSHLGGNSYITATSTGGVEGFVMHFTADADF